MMGEEVDFLPQLSILGEIVGKGARAVEEIGEIVEKLLKENTLKKLPKATAKNAFWVFFNVLKQVVSDNFWYSSPQKIEVVNSLLSSLKEILGILAKMEDLEIVKIFEEEKKVEEVIDLLHALAVRPHIPIHIGLKAIEVIAEIPGSRGRNALLCFARVLHFPWKTEKEELLNKLADIFSKRRDLEGLEVLGEKGPEIIKTINKVKKQMEGD